MTFFLSNTKNQIPSNTKIITIYIKVEIISKRQLACVYNMKYLFLYKYVY